MGGAGEDSSGHCEKWESEGRSLGVAESFPREARSVAGGHRRAPIQHEFAALAASASVNKEDARRSAHRLLYYLAELGEVGTRVQKMTDHRFEVKRTGPTNATESPSTAMRHRSPLISTPEKSPQQIAATTRRQAARGDDQRRSANAATNPCTSASFSTPNGTEVSAIGSPWS